MPVTATTDDALATRRRAVSKDATFWHTSFIGANRYGPASAQSSDPGAVYPVAFLVEQDPDVTVGAHFHQSDQFQVVVQGAGRLGTHAVAPIAIHFTAAFSPYGPIRAGAEGISYFTLRNGWDPGARYMPGARADLPRPRRHREAMAGPLTAVDALAAGRESILGPEPDGLAAWRWRLLEDARLEGPDPQAGRGQFWLVLGGTLMRDGQALGRHACVFIGGDEPALVAAAGAGGLDLLVMQFPHRPDPAA